MWQRSQTLYFAIVVGLLLSLALGNVATIIVPGQEAETVRYISKLPYAVLIFLPLICNLLAVFCWSHRGLQMRLAGASAVLILALQGWLAVDYFTMDASFVFRWTAIFPLVALVFELLAMRGVYADELLVRSSSRLRSSKRMKK